MKHPYLKKDGKDHFFLGCNYVCSTGGQLMWRHWDPEQVTRDCKVMQDLGMDLVRIFLFMPDYMPTPESFSDEMFDRLAFFLDRAAENNLAVLPSIVIGHVSSGIWDIPWRDGRDWYGDEWFVGKQAEFCAETARRCKDHPALYGYLLTNEPFEFGKPADSETGGRWVRTLVEAIREIDPDKVVSTGCGAWGQEAIGSYALDFHHFEDIVDYYGPHNYASFSNDATRQSFSAAFGVNFLTDLPKPIMMEEFGSPTLFSTDESIAGLYRMVLAGCFAEGTCGILNWALQDIPLPSQRPYAYATHESTFGMLDGEGNEKASAREYRRFGEIIRKIDVGEWQWPDWQGRILLPYNFSQPTPCDDIKAPLLRQRMYEAYLHARAAQVPVALWREPILPDDLRFEPIDYTPPEQSLLLSPCLQKLAHGFWEHLLEWIRGGKTFYTSFFSGEYGWRGMWNPLFEEFFGATNCLQHGLVQMPPETITLAVTEDLLPLRKGETYTLRRQGPYGPASFCPVELTTGRAIMVDDRGNPALVRHDVGDGHVLLSTYPLEYYAIETPDYHEQAWTWKVYRAAAELAGTTACVESGNPRVSSTLLEHDDGRRALVWLMNPLWRNEMTALRLCDAWASATATDFETGRAVDPAAIEVSGHDYRVVELRK